MYVTTQAQLMLVYEITEEFITLISHIGKCLSYFWLMPGAWFTCFN